MPVLGMYLEKTIIWKDTFTPMFTAALFTIAKTWEHPKCPSAQNHVIHIHWQSHVFSSSVDAFLLPCLIPWLCLPALRWVEVMRVGLPKCPSAQNHVIHIHWQFRVFSCSVGAFLLPCLIPMAVPSSSTLSRSDESGPLCLAPDFSGLGFQLITVECYAGCGEKLL